LLESDGIRQNPATTARIRRFRIPSKLAESDQYSQISGILFGFQPI
jgi:hypothetical protein